MSDKIEIDVLESDVFLEISNGIGKVITVKRPVKSHAQVDARLISVWEGPVLSKPTGNYQKHDFYVRDPGSAKNGKGFHAYLESFIGWDLPSVRTYDGREILLYMECVFPLLIVEQKRGWGGIQANTPTSYRIKDVEKRAVEFLAKLEAYEISIKKQTLEEEKINLKNEWKSHVSTCEGLLTYINGSARSLPNNPTTEWPPVVQPYIEVNRDDVFIPIKRAIKEDKLLLSELEAEEIPTVQQVEPQLIKELEEARFSLEEKEVVLRAHFEDLNMEKEQIKAIEVRLKALNEDLRRNKDIEKIRNYGSNEKLISTHGTCPVCHQSTPDYLFAEASHEQPMTIDENIKFIKSQKEIFEKMKENTNKAVAIKERQLVFLRNQVNDIRSQIRALKQTLTSNDRSPSISSLRKRILLEERIRLESNTLDEFDFHCDKFHVLAGKWKSILEKEKLLPDDNLSKSDRSKIKRLESLFNQQLKAYGFSSFRTGIEISYDTYRPTLEGFNLTFDVSASDHIRTIWAYLSGLLELSREFETNHPGMLVFDEPRQQDADAMSYAELLRRSSISKEYNQQIIFATSEKKESLQEALADCDYKLHDFSGKMIQKLRR